ncbi:hypothetical protein [Campylobacter concisus]
MKDNAILNGSNSRFDKMASFKFSAMARYLTFKFLFFKFELLNLAINLHDIYCSKRRKILVIATALFWCSGFHFKFKKSL